MPRKHKDQDDVVKILYTRILKRNTRIHNQYFVEWKAHLNKPNSWVYDSHLSRSMVKEFRGRRALLKTGAGSSVTQAGSDTAVEQAVEDSDVTQSKAHGVVTRAGTSNAFIQRQANIKVDKSTQTDNYWFLRFDYK